MEVAITAVKAGTGLTLAVEAMPVMGVEMKQLVEAHWWNLAAVAMLRAAAVK